MNQKLSFFLSFLCLFTFLQCKRESKKIETDQEFIKTKYVSDASSFRLIPKDHAFLYQQIHGNDTISQSIDKQKLPFQKMAILSSSAIGYLEALDGLNHVQAVYNANWIYSPKVHELIDDKKITDAGNAASANLETILALDVDAIIAFHDPNQAKLLESVKKAGISVICVDEYLEKTPLGKAEYLKLLGVLLNKKAAADSLFSVIKNNYNSIKNKALSQKLKPTVFAEIMRGDIWYMPGGNSFQATYFEDAGAHYLWSDNTSSGTINLNFEQIFEKAEKADFWMNAADFVSWEQLQNAYKNHDWFDAFQQKKVYSFSKRMNAEGANDYFETGTVRADWVLSDLVHIFHPEINPEHEMYFYRKLNSEEIIH